MKLLIFVAMQLFTINVVFADSNISIEFDQFNKDHISGPEYIVPVTGNIRDNNLNLEYRGTDIANVSVKDKNGSIVYQNSINGKNTINLSGYAQGDYTVKVEDTKGNSAVAQFQVTK